MKNPNELTPYYASRRARQLALQKRERELRAAGALGARKAAREALELNPGNARRRRRERAKRQTNERRATRATSGLAGAVRRLEETVESFFSGRRKKLSHVSVLASEAAGAPSETFDLARQVDQEKELMPSLREKQTYSSWQLRRLKEDIDQRLGEVGLPSWTCLSTAVLERVHEFESAVRRLARSLRDDKKKLIGKDDELLPGPHASDFAHHYLDVCVKLLERRAAVKVSKAVSKRLQDVRDALEKLLRE